MRYVLNLYIRFDFFRRKRNFPFQVAWSGVLRNAKMRSLRGYATDRSRISLLDCIAQLLCFYQSMQHRIINTTVTIRRPIKQFLMVVRCGSGNSPFIKLTSAIETIPKGITDANTVDSFIDPISIIFFSGN